MFASGDYVVVYHKKTIPYVIISAIVSPMCGQLCRVKRIGDDKRPFITVNSMQLDKISKNEAAALLGLA